ncbi:Transcriptional activator spt7 [Dipsacomyces acuminosporus]|nr:Transcriptional activator spt7 [Dipsacomyces acuminosporus]
MESVAVKAAHDDNASRLSAADIDLTDDWVERSYQIALRIYERGEWPTYLTAAELPWLAKALESQELWSKFISPRKGQWQINPPPPLIFDITSSNPQKTADLDSAALKLQSTGAASSDIGTSGAAGNKRSTPEDSDEAKRHTNGNDGNDAKAEKRAKTATSASSADSDDEMLSVLSGSDIDMGLWTGDASIASNAMSPESATGAKPYANTSHAGDLAATESSIVCAIAAFHARAAIFEQYVSVLCGPSECSMCTDIADTRADISGIEARLNAIVGKNNGGACRLASEANNEEALAAKVPSFADTQAPATLVSRSLDEDDDYDDDEDDGEPSSGSKATNSAQTGDSSADVRPSSDTRDVSASGLQEDSAAKASAFSFDLASDARIATRAVFHTLDELAEVVGEQTRHEGSIRAVKDVVDQRAAEPKDMLVNQIGSLYHMKNLAQFIDNHRDSVSMTTRELTHLLSEVRPKRSKWASDRRVGQEQLYNALENALHELKVMGPAAAPFLTQVKRRDAPDYYDVIRRPMDLSAMSKKLRNLQYNSKEEFASDIQLIRDNCYMYNTEPGNIYRRNVDSLLKKAKYLLESVPNITIKDRSGGDIGPGEDANTEFGDESGDESQGARTIYGQREGSVLADDGTPAPGAIDNHSQLARASSDDPTNISASALDSSMILCDDPQPQPQPQQKPQQPLLSALAQNISRTMANGALSCSAISELADGYELTLGEKIWRSRVRRQLANFSQQLEEDAHNEIADCHMSIRTAEKMHGFYDHTHDVLEHVCGRDVQTIESDADISELLVIHPQISGTAGAAAARKRNESLDEKRREWLQKSEDLDANAWQFVSESEPAAGLPQLESLERQIRKDGVVQWLNDDCESTVAEVFGAAARRNGGIGASSDTACSLEPAPSTLLLAANSELASSRKERPSLEAYAAARFPNNHMWQGMADNIERLRNIREIDNKIWTAKLNVPVGYLYPGGGGEGSSKAKGSAEDTSSVPVRDLHGDYPSRPDPDTPLRLDAATARKLLERTSALILAHAGFEAIADSALSCLSDFLIDFMNNLGRTVRTYSDKYSKKLSTEAILAHSLYANGTEDLVELEYYMRGEVDKYAGKLTDLNKKLKRSYQDFVSDGRPDSGIADASSLESEGAYVTGVVGGLGDLGEDFFGFKELGLDKELGLEHLSVPQRLWYGKNSAQHEGASHAANQERLAHPLPKPWASIVSPQGQIGLMRAFICEKLKAKNGASPPGYEDEADKDDKEEPAPASTSTPTSAKMPEQWEPIPEDESLPTKARYGASRPKVPQPNYLTHPRTHMHVGSGKSVAAPGRSAKKKPTTGSKTASKRK